MKIGLYVCIDKVSSRPVDWFVAENDGVAQRNGTSVFSRIRPAKDLQFARVADVDTDDPRSLEPVKYRLVADDAYKFPETVAVPIGEYKDLKTTAMKFQQKVSDIRQNPSADQVRDVTM